MKKHLIFFLLILAVVACRKVNNDQTSETISDSIFIETDSLSVKEPIKKSTAQIKAELTAKGFKTFDFFDKKTQDTILMQQYFIAFLKTGPIRATIEEEAEKLQNEHLAHLGKMYELGYADISGPFGDNGNIKGITIYNVPTLKMADSLAKSDPMVKAGLLEIEIHPWWAGKGLPLR
jgi:uncharacterized protein